LWIAKYIEICQEKLKEMKYTMFKNILIFILISSYTIAQKQQQFPFVGLSISSEEIDLGIDKQRESTFSLHYGKQTLDWRTTFAYNYNNSYQSLSVDIDKILLDELFGTAKIRPFLGLSAAAVKFDDDSLEDAYGYYYGGNAGFIFYLTDRIDLDIAYHYRVIEEIDTAKNIQSISFSLHYFF